MVVDTAKIVAIVITLTLIGREVNIDFATALYAALDSETGLSASIARTIPAGCVPREGTSRCFTVVNLAPSVGFVRARHAAEAQPAFVTLAWDPPDDGEPPASYLLEAGSAPGLADLASLDVGGQRTILTVGPVMPGTYYVRLRARNHQWVVSEPSNEITVRIGDEAGHGTATCTDPLPPAQVTSAVTGSRIAVSWTASPSAISYHIDVGSTPGASDLYSANVGNATAVEAAASRGIYFIRVRARSHCGISAPSQEIVVTTGAPQI